MNVKFYLQGNKNYSSIYVRIRDTIIDAKANTGLRVKPKNFKNGQIKLNKLTQKDVENKKKVILENNELIILQDKLDEIEKLVTTKFNNKKDYEIINSRWLKNIIQPTKTNELPTLLIKYFDFYVRRRAKSMKQSTLKKINVFKNRIINYQNDRKIDLHLPEINKRFSLDFQEWCDEKSYAHNTKIQTLKTIKTICTHANEYGVAVNPEYNLITKGLKPEKKDNIHLNFDEIEKIIQLKTNDKQLDIARDWLVISCYTALRVSDNLKLTKDKIKKIDDSYFLQIVQQKTGKPVDIYLDNKVMKILKKRNMNFPPVFSANKNSNEAIYNRLIKEVCRLAGINQKIEVYRKNHITNRYETKIVPKYSAVSSHIGRRSFATNYYGIIPTSLLIGQTGHSSEKQFLRYVGKKGNDNAILLAKLMKNLNK